MIFSTFNQLNCFLLFLYFGIILGLISKIFFILFLNKFQKIIIKNIIFAIFYTFFSIFFVFLINFYNLGQFSYALILAYILGFLWFNFLSKNLVVFLENKWYTIIRKLKQRVFKRKLNDTSKEN